MGLLDSAWRGAVGVAKGAWNAAMWTGKRIPGAVGNTAGLAYNVGRVGGGVGLDALKALYGASHMVAKHPVEVGLGLAGGAMALGTINSANRGPGGSIRASNLRNAGTPAAYTYAGPSEYTGEYKGDNLGATGDLTTSLHNLRHGA